MLKLKSRNKNVIIIQVYAPTSPHGSAEQQQKNEDETNIFYDELQHLVDSNAKRDELLIIGDFNAKIGGLEISYPDNIGKHNNAIRGSNDRGTRLANFCKINKLFICNSGFKHRRKYTWVSPGERVYNTVDYIICRTASFRKLRDCHTLAHPDISDHRMVRCLINTRFIRARTIEKRTPRFDLKKLTSQLATSNAFAETVTTKLSELSDPTNLSIQALTDNTISVLIESSKTILGRPPSTEVPSWMSENTLNEIKRKHEIRAQLGHRSIEYKLQKSTVKKLSQIDKENQIDRDHRELNDLPPDARYYNLMKRLKLSSEKQVKSWGINSKEKCALSTTDGILDRWADFYADLYDSDTAGKTNYPEPDTIPLVTFNELQHAIKQLKSNKAPGPDGLAAEMFKHGGEALQRYLMHLINMIITKRETPSQLQLSEIITLFKKGDRNDCKNYRPISLLSHLYKLIMQIIYNRISKDLIASLPSEQAAYQPGRNTIEMIQMMQQIIEKSNEFQRNIAICFIDYTKAFDSIDQSKLWDGLHQYTNLNPAYINLISLIYENSKACIRTDIGLTREIELLKGVKQGDLLSALLFCVALKIILENTFLETDKNIVIGGVHHTNGAYADDLGIIGDSVSELNNILERLRQNSLNFGLHINISKTRAMLIGNHDGNTDIPKINGEPIDIVEKFEYLGRVLSRDGGDMPALKDRIGKAWGAFEKIKHIITSKHIALRKKKTAYFTYILPAVMYATETMTWNAEMSTKIEVFNNNIMRWILGVRLRERVSIAQLRQKTTIPPILPAIKQRKLKWFGHMKRSNLPVRTTFEGLVEGTRRRGRPKRRWRDDVAEWCETLGNWSAINKTTMDRDAWRKHCNAFC